MGWIVFGVILLILAVAFFFGSRGERNKLAAISAVETLSAQTLSQMHQRVTTSLGADVFAEPVEVVGTIECEMPLSGPVSGKQCVAYTYTVSREYEEDVTETDAQGKSTTSTRKSSEQTQSDSKRVMFWVRDSSGRTRVLPDDAELDLEQSGERFDQAYSSGGRTRTLGHRHREQALMVGAQVYVLGTAVDRQGEVAVAKDPKGGKFIVSRKSERELSQAAAGSARGYMIAAGVCGALGLIMVIIGIVSR